MMTMQKIEIATKDGKKFLRKVMREDGWDCYARKAEGWTLTFRKEIKAKQVGDPDSQILVETDCILGERGNTGRTQAFHDAEPVDVPAATRMRLSTGDTSLMAKLLMADMKPVISYSAGSVHSSRHGLAFVSLRMTDRLTYGGVSFGETIYKDGQVLTIGPAE